MNKKAAIKAFWLVCHGIAATVVTVLILMGITRLVLYLLESLPPIPDWVGPLFLLIGLLVGLWYLVYCMIRFDENLKRWRDSTKE